MTEDRSGAPTNRPAFNRRQLLRCSLALAGLGLISGRGGMLPVALATRVQRIGVPSVNALGAATHLQGLLRALPELGWVEGQNLAVEYRWAEGRVDRLPDLVADLARLPVDLIVALDSPTAVAAKHATETIPIVFVGAADPVRQGLVASLAHPGGNVTGVSLVGLTLRGKRLVLQCPFLSRCSSGPKTGGRG